ncbi:MAG TPA: hypothetical protein VFX03_16660, partial [Thermomicrobiales bacterium]|nr:hypothetical protein [Thermomicrobiales bacterium]
MRPEAAIRTVAFGCAVFLLFGLIGDRTSWARGATIITDSAGYNLVAFASGVVALSTLAIGLWSRRWAAASALVAGAAFAVAANLIGTYALALWRGEALLEGRSRMGPGWTVDPAFAPPFFAFAALVGAASAIILATRSLRRPNVIGSIDPNGSSASASPGAKDAGL